MTYQIIKYYRQIQLTTRIPALVTYTGPGDEIGVQATAWWGLRAYSDQAIGRNAIKLRRSSDNATQNFATLDDGSIDIAAITAFKGAANLFVDTLYDQIGNFPLFQSTAANQPQFILNGLGANPVMRFVSATPLFVLTAINMTLPVPYTWSVVAKRTATATEPVAMGVGSGSVGWRLTNIAQMIQGGGAFVDAPATDNVFHAIQYILSSSTSADISVDGVDTLGNPIAANNITNSPVSVGAGIGPSNPADMDLVEAGIWGISFSAVQENSLSVNQHTYWGF